ncbi:MAG: GHKL domain-containing protein [Clostridia bacterium]|nr:GHKL domain-containing protein [Clostridia bacterium]
MIKKLRRQFIVSITASAFALLMVVVASINFVNIISIDKRMTDMLDHINENGGVFNTAESDGPISELINYEELSYITRFFYVEFSQDGRVTAVNTQNIAAVDDAAAVEYAKAALSSGKADGYGEEMYRYTVKEIGSGKRVCFLDVQEELMYIGSMITISITIALFFFLLLTVVVVLVSGYFIRPVEENSLKQKQFIADAGHELKTPLAIISANTEVLEMTCGENDWTLSIRKQTGRMADLVNQMLVLARMEERIDKKNFQTVALNEIVENAADAFAVLAQKDAKKIKLSVWPGTRVYCDEKSVSELVNILIDNAVKYSPPESQIDIRLNKKNKSVVFEVENSLIPGESVDTDRMFDRFYRADKSRSREAGSHGLGLSIAKAVAEKHKADISARTQKEKIIFTVIFYK